MIHLVKVTVDPSRLEDYKQILKEEIEISLRTEPGVYVLYALSDNTHPFFTGGVIGTFVGGTVWGMYGWTGVVVSGFTFILLCLLAHLIYLKTIKSKEITP